MAPSRKVEIIRRKKTYNGHYCQQCHIYYQGYKHKCPIPQNRSNSLTTSSEGGGWINPNLMIVKPKAKSLMLKEFDSWPKSTSKKSGTLT